MSPHHSAQNRVAKNTLRPILTISLFVALSLSNVVIADEQNGANFIYGINDYLYLHSKGTSNEKALGQTLIVINDEGFTSARAHHIAVMMARPTGTTSGNVCLEFGSPGNVLQSKCIAVTNVPTSSGWVDFYFSPTVSVTPGDKYEYYVYYTGTCTNCVRAYYATTNEYLPAYGNDAVRLSRTSNTQAWVHPDQDSTFLFYIDHSPIMVTSTASGVTSDAATLRGWNKDDSGYIANIYYDWGTTTSYGQQTSTISCPESETLDSADYCTRSISGLQPSTLYHYRICGSNYVGHHCGIDQTFTTEARCPGQIVLWQHVNYGGGCRGFDINDLDFTNGELDPSLHDLFDNGVSINDQVGSIQVNSGYTAILHAHSKNKGQYLIVPSNDSDLTADGFNDRASSLRIVPCDGTAPVVLFQHQQYDGGCISYYGDDFDFTNNAFSNGAGLNDQVTSLWVKEGYEATLYADINGLGDIGVVLNHDSNVVNSGFNDKASGLRISAPAAAPANDAHNRPALIDQFSVYNARQSTTGATTQSSEQLACGTATMGATVWFKFTAINSGTARVSTWGSDYDTALAAYSGNSLGSSRVGCNNDSAGGLQSRLEFTCVQGQEYRIQVGGRNGATGNLIFQHSGCLSFRQDPFVTTPADPYCVSSNNENRFEVLYVRPNDVPDLYDERVPRIRELVREMNGFLRQDAAMQGGRTADYRVGCTGGVIDVTPVFLDMPSQGDLIAGLINHATPFTEDDAKYIVWFERRYDCGGGYATGLPSGTDAFSPQNPINSGPHWAVVDCGDSAHGSAVMMHEAGHAMGAVHNDAPDSDGGGHCTDKRSMLCDDDSQGFTCEPSDPNCCEDLHYDCGFDSYFNPNPQPGDWLFSNWNQGHHYNSFLQFTPGPAHDHFAARTTIGAPFSQSLSTQFATHEASEHMTTCASLSNTVWYRFTPEASGTATLTTAGSNFDTVLGVYTGSSLGSLTQVACNDDSGGTTSQVSFSATGGVTYAIQAGGKGAATGSLQFQLTCSPNDCTPNEAPSTPSLSCTPDPSQTGETVTCTFSSTDADSTGVYYTVDWGDGSTTRIPSVGTVTPGTSQSASRSYLSTGTYTISVTATDNGSPAETSAAATHSQDVQLVVNQPPGSPSLTCSPNPSVTGQTVACSFSSSDPDSTGVYYTVAWGDGATTRVPSSGTVLPGTTQSASRAYTDQGTYTISVTATDNGSPAETSDAATRSQTVNQAPVSIPYNQNFDGGSASGWTLSGLWQVTNCRSSSPSYSLGYNNPGCPTSFDTGAATSGSAVTPPVDLPAGSSPHLTWNGWYETESGTTYDRKTVDISTDDGATWTQLYQESGTQSTWHARDIDLSAYAGDTVRLRFHFDSVDSFANSGEGWYVDNVAVANPVATVPGAPRSLDATAGPNPGEISLTWLAPLSDGGSPVTSYKVYVSTSLSGPFSLDGTVSSSTRSYVDSGLGNGATRYYRVTAVNSVGEGPVSNTDGATTWTAPSAPQNLDAAPGSSFGQIRVTWSAPANTGGTSISHYELYRSTSAGGSFTMIATPSGTSYTDGGRTLAQTYYYYAKAVNPVGSGPASNTDCSKPYPDALGVC